MTNNRRTKSIFKIFASQLAVALFVAALSLSILFYAEGYRFNYKNLKVSKTGVIALNSFPREATIKVNDKIKAKKTPFSENLLSGYYNVEILKAGYFSWTQSVMVEPELVKNFKNIVLFKEKPEIRSLTDQKTIKELNSPIDTLAVRSSNGLFQSDYEIWVDGDLITRFSEPIYRAIWYTDKQHILYQQGQEIRVIESTGTNDTLLISLSESFPTSFFTNDKGDQLYYKDGSEYKVAAVR